MSMTRPDIPRLSGEGSQAMFDVIMRSISEPGTIRHLPADHLTHGVPTIAWLALALADVDVKVGANEAALAASTPSVTDLVADATGAAISDLSEAWIALLDQPSPADMARLARGTALEPELGARVALAANGLAQTEEAGATTLLLTGPGIPGTRSLAVSGVDPTVLAGLGRASGEFPTGIDTWLFTPDGHLAAIPRSTHLTLVHNNATLDITNQEQN